MTPIEQLPYFYGIGLAPWEIQFIKNFGGITVEEITVEQIKSVCSTNNINKIFVSETSITRDADYLFDRVEDKTITQLVIYTSHPFDLPLALLDRINDEKHDNVVFLSNGHFDKEYPNIKGLCFEEFEHGISHHFNLLLSTRLRTRRNPDKDFLCYTVTKDKFRKLVVDFLKGTDIFDNSITNFAKKSEEIQQPYEDFITSIVQEHGEEFRAPMDVFNRGMPNFESYEKSFCEIVLETRNSGSYHITEKTFRPIAFGIPIVLLAEKQLFDKLVNYGYRFYDHDFYSHWHSDIILGEKLPYLLAFLKHIKQDQSARNSMTEIAHHNYLWFWNNRKNNFYEKLYKFFNDISDGNNTVAGIYKKLNR